MCGGVVILINICSLKQLRKQLKKKKKARKKDLPTPINPQSPKLKTKQKPKITTATALALQQACPCHHPAHLYNPDNLILENINYKMPFAHSPGTELHASFTSPLGWLPSREGSEASHALYPAATRRKRSNCSTSLGREEGKGRAGHPPPLAPPGASLLCALQHSPTRQPG